MKKKNMYEDAGCDDRYCRNGEVYYSGATDLSVSSWHRCKCSKVKTKEYKEFLAIPQKVVDKMTVKEYRTLKESFVDQYKHITSGSNETDRSW